MIEKSITQFSISHRQIIDNNGELLGALESIPEFINNTQLLLDMYQLMVQTRLFDAKAIALQRTGKLGTYPSTLGQEAIGVGIGSAMKLTDVLCPYYREYGAQLWRGVSMEEILTYWGGDEQGSNFKGPREDFPICIPIASQTLHAVGVATAIKLRGQKRASVTVIGDGGTSRGDFYEAMNVAGVWKLPVVFVINNNQWAISVNRDNQSASETLAQKGIACGIPGEQIDGNDILMMHLAVNEALERAYRGLGPSVIEAMTYRMCDHTTADDASRYRNESELKAAEKTDPIARMKKFLIHRNLWSEDQDNKLLIDCTELLEKSVKNYLNIETRSPETMFDNLYAALPEPLASQREEVRKLIQGGS